MKCFRLSVHTRCESIVEKNKIIAQPAVPRCWSQSKLWIQLSTWVANLKLRNIFTKFSYDSEGGSSTVPCSETYSGPSAFSEKETQALMDFYATIADKTECYICFHSAAKLLMYPLGHTASVELVPNVEDLDAIAKATVEALEEVDGTVYRYGNAMTTLYTTSGSSRDHAYGHFNTPLVFTYEMREGPDSIFILPPEQIDINALEVFTSLLALIEKSKELNYFQKNNWSALIKKIKFVAQPEILSLNYLTKLIIDQLSHRINCLSFHSVCTFWVSLANHHEVCDSFVLANSCLLQLRSWFFKKLQRPQSCFIHNWQRGAVAGSSEIGARSWSKKNLKLLRFLK